MIIMSIMSIMITMMIRVIIARGEGILVQAAAAGVPLVERV